MKPDTRVREGTVLVTGARGFIGSRLTPSLLSRFDRVVGTVRPGAPAPGDPPDCLPLDVADASAVERTFANVAPSVVIHLAGYSSAVQSQSMIRDTFVANAVGTVNVLDAAITHNVEQVIYIGSMEEPGVGGRQVAGSPYGASKYVGTVYTEMCSALYDIACAVLQVYFVYGPGNQKAEKLIPYVIQSYLNAESPALGSGSRSMDWVYIDDVVEAIHRTIAAGHVSPPSLPVGSGSLTSVRDVVKKIERIMEVARPAKFGALEDRQFEMATVADVSVCREALGWSPGTTLEEGLRKTVEWYRDRRGAA